MYATAMLEALPYCGFRWAKEEDIKLIEEFIKNGEYALRDKRRF